MSLSLSIYIYLLISIQIHDKINISLRTRPKKQTHRILKIPHHISQRVFFNQPNSGGQPWKVSKNAETSGALERCHLSCAWRDECQLSTWLRTSTLHPVGWSPAPLLRNTPISLGLKNKGTTTTIMLLKTRDGCVQRGWKWKLQFSSILRLRSGMKSC